VKRRKLGAAAVCVERAGELFSRAAASIQIGALNIAGAAVSPSYNDGTQAVF
jgi:hypothetical protein